MEQVFSYPLASQKARICSLRDEWVCDDIRSLDAPEVIPSGSTRLITPNDVVMAPFASVTWVFRS
jgi:hypothetical protein